MKLTQEVVGQGGLFGAGLFLRDGAALGMGVLERKTSSREQGLAWVG